MNDDQLRKLWRDAGGEFHGPRVETGYMPEAQLLPFLKKQFDVIFQLRERLQAKCEQELVSFNGRDVEALAAATAALGEPQTATPARPTFNEWWVMLPEGRRNVLMDDKWRLAEAAYEAGGK